MYDYKCLLVLIRFISFKIFFVLEKNSHKNFFKKNSFDLIKQLLKVVKGTE